MPTVLALYNSNHFKALLELLVESEAKAVGARPGQSGSG